MSDPSPGIRTDLTSQPAPPASFQLIATLAAISIISGLLVATTFEVTRDPIMKNRREALEKAVFTVLPTAKSRRNFLLDASGLKELPDSDIAQANLYAGYDADGRLTGVAMEGSARGYQDVVKILYSYVPDRQIITGFTVLQSSETPGLGDRVESDPGFLANFQALEASLNPDGTALAHAIVTVKNGSKEHSWQIDAISGATITSTAIGNALNSSAAEMLPNLQKHQNALEKN